MPRDPICQRILGYQKPGESDRAFALRIGENGQNVSNWRRGSIPRMDTVRRLCERNGWNESYVLNGDGRRFARRAASRETNAYADGLRAAAIAFVRKAQELAEEAEAIDGVGLEELTELHLTPPDA